MRRVFVDMDGVLANFDEKKNRMGITGDELKVQYNAYRDLQPIPGAISGVRALIQRGFDVYIASKPPTAIPHAYADKVHWILDHLPELQRKIILTPNKSLLGDERDFLIDDHVDWNHNKDFPGTKIHFGSSDFPNWGAVLRFFKLYSHV